MCFSRLAYQEVLEVFKDISGLNQQLKIKYQQLKSMENERLFLEDVIQKTRIDLCKLKEEIVVVKVDQEVQTELLGCTPTVEQACSERREEEDSEHSSGDSNELDVFHIVLLDKSHSSSVVESPVKRKLVSIINMIQKKVKIFLKKKELEIPSLARRKTLLIQTNDLLMKKNKEMISCQMTYKELKLQLGRYRLVQELMNSLAAKNKEDTFEFEGEFLATAGEEDVMEYIDNNDNAEQDLEVTEAETGWNCQLCKSRMLLSDSGVN